MLSKGTGQNPSMGGRELEYVHSVGGEGYVLACVFFLLFFGMEERGEGGKFY